MTPRPTRAAATAAPETDVPHAFFKHPRHSRVSFNNAALTFRAKGVGRISGLKRWLDATFVPPAAEFASYGDRTERRTRDVRCNGAGAEHGKLVDTQLQAWAAGRGLENADPCAARIARAIRHLDLRPLATQVMVYDERAGWATAVDMIAADKNNRLVALEFKTTRYPTTYSRQVHGKYFRGPLKNMPYSVWAHHQLQLAAPVVALHELYATDVAAAYVLLAYPPNAVDVFPLQPIFMRAIQRRPARAECAAT